jgi:hypothetical protein
MDIKYTYEVGVNEYLGGVWWELWPANKRALVVLIQF